MSDPITDLIWNRRPTADRPLLGQTVLVVEDSRFACEAMRLLCLRSGARIRRANSLRAAARHLAVYRPSVVVVDIGLPDGSGTSLLRDLARAQPRVAVLLAISGDDAHREAALAAGADDFLAKPFTSLAAFQSAVLAHLPPEARPQGPRAPPGNGGPPRPHRAPRRPLPRGRTPRCRPRRPGPRLRRAVRGRRGHQRARRGPGKAAADLRASRSSGTGVQAAIQSLARLIDTRIARAGVV